MDTKTAADAIRDKVAANFENEVARDRAFLVAVLAELGLAETAVNLAHVATLILSEGLSIVREYPKWLYHRDQAAVIVDSEDEAAQLGDGWVSEPIIVAEGETPPPAPTKYVADLPITPQPPAAPSLPPPQAEPPVAPVMVPIDPNTGAVFSPAPTPGDTPPLTDAPIAEAYSPVDGHIEPVASDAPVARDIIPPPPVVEPVAPPEPLPPAVEPAQPVTAEPLPETISVTDAPPPSIP